MHNIKKRTLRTFYMVHVLSSVQVSEFSYFAHRKKLKPAYCALYHDHTPQFVPPIVTVRGKARVEVRQLALLE